MEKSTHLFDKVEMRRAADRGEPTQRGPRQRPQGVGRKDLRCGYSDVIWLLLRPCREFRLR
jgi:hypothetical protein